MKILAFAASSSSKSINQQLVRHAVSLVDSESEVLDLNDYELPLYSEDREAALGQPQLAQDFLDRIAEADALVIAFAEHNGSYAVAYKNTFDWASRINMKVFQGKPMLMMATSPGPGGGANVLSAAVNSAPYFDGDVRASLSVPSFHDNFDSERGVLTDAALATRLADAMNQLLEDRPVALSQAS